KLGGGNKLIGYETRENPVAEFFKRYGLKLALVSLSLICFYRVSDIFSDVISNVFFKDLNISKGQITIAVTVLWKFFNLVGGFLGGLLAQKMNIMKLMFVGAVLACSTNLIFIGLVKSGEKLAAVEVRAGNQVYQAQTDEVGYWKLDIPSAVLAQSKQLQVSAAYLNIDNTNQAPVQVNMPYLTAEQGSTQLQILPITSDNTLTVTEQDKTIVVRGQYVGEALQEN